MVRKPGPQTDSVLADASAPAPRFYSVRELADIFGRSPRTVRGWLQSGKLSCVMIGKTRFVSAAVIENPSRCKGG